MGINPTQSNFKSFTFDGVNSRQYGVYITGAGVFNAPERNVEMIDIAGRNGAFVLDKGNFLNIEVTYPASIACDNEADFAKAVSDLRNLLCSKVGYVRLEDDYNPNEYRLAIYKSGLEVSHDFLIAGEFDLVFECKPQRYLKSGETAISVTSGDTITNPTRFDAKPMLEATGYGEIDINGQSIAIDNDPIGVVPVFNSTVYQSPSNERQITIDTQYANVGDSIDFSGYLLKCGWGTSSSGVTLSDISVSGITGNGTATITETGTSYFRFEQTIDAYTFVYGTSHTESISATYSCTSSADGVATKTVTVSVEYDGDSTFIFRQVYDPPVHFMFVYGRAITVGNMLLNSTQYSVGAPLYIDLEIGEAYKIEGGSAVSVNNAVSLPSELPTLASGANTITYDNTITQLDIVPRWWKV